MQSQLLKSAWCRASCRSALNHVTRSLSGAVSAYAAASSGTRSSNHTEQRLHAALGSHALGICCMSAQAPDAKKHNHILIFMCRSPYPKCARLDGSCQKYNRLLNFVCRSPYQKCARLDGIRQLPKIQPLTHLRVQVALKSVRAWTASGSCLVARNTHTHLLSASRPIRSVRAWTASGSCLVTPLAISRSSRSGRLACRRASVPDSAPTGLWFLPLYCVGSDTCAATRHSLLQHASLDKTVTTGL